MNQERAMMRGLLAERRMAFQREEIRADGLLTALRMLLNPYVEAVALDEEKIQALARDLCEGVARMKKLRSEIARIEESLDG